MKESNPGDQTTPVLGPHNVVDHADVCWQATVAALKQRNDGTAKELLHPGRHLQGVQVWGRHCTTPTIRSERRE